MMVIIANYLPPAVRGRLKVWFIEPRPNVFVSGINKSLSRKIVAYVMEACPPESGIMIFAESNRPPGFEISALGTPKKKLTDLTGLQLVVESTK